MSAGIGIMVSSINRVRDLCSLLHLFFISSVELQNVEKTLEN